MINKCNQNYYDFSKINTKDIIKTTVEEVTDPYLAFIKGNLIKYACRFDRKYPTSAEQIGDLIKLIDYANMAIQHLEVTDKPNNSDIVTAKHFKD